MNIDLYQTATGLLEKIRRKDISALELLEDHLQQIEERNPEINAVVITDAERATERAKGADEALTRGESWGPLHGLPMTVKDAFEVEGLASTGGSPKWKGHVPKRNADVVQRLVDAGAIVFGKTNVPMLSGDFQTFNDIYGITNNPWDVTKTPGGSSGGAAAALAAGMTPLEIGSDIGGSIRTPAHFCGVYGHKPSYGIVSMRGHIPPPPGCVNDGDTLSVAGPLARSSEDLELALSLLAAPKMMDGVAWELELPPPRHETLNDYRVAVWLDDPYCPVERAIADAIQGVVEKLAKCGVKIVETHPDISLGMNDRIFWDLVPPVIATGFPPNVIDSMRKLLDSSEPDDDSLPVRQARGALIPHKDWLSANERRHRVRAKWHELFRDYDVLLCPPTVTSAFEHDHRPNFFQRKLIVNGEPRPYFDLMVWAGLAINAQLPATVAPVALSDDGMPVGIQIIGPYLEDRTTVKFAGLLEKVCGGFNHPPKIN